MKQALKVAGLLLVIGFLLGYIGLSARSIRAEQTQLAKPAPFSTTTPYSSFQFGPPPPPPMLPPFEPPLFDPFTQSPTVAVPKPKPPKFAPPPHVDDTCIGTADPCQLRRVVRI